ncbi:transcription factor SOX-12-like [Camellia sinensis]|uniref:transcription factor SOX-12-like n=1 Tax=Camellia sinensis TaxID=4442 RepID=UPI001036E1C0|nr:transcription factor SOX-12-like [Camellia sinensis]
MTCRGQGGETYQIPITPPPPDHELVGFYGLPLPPFQMSAAGGAPAGPSASTRGGGRAGRVTVVHPRTKAWRTHVGSSSRAPIPDDDESETEAEAESSEDKTGDDSGSSSDGGRTGRGTAVHPRTKVGPTHVGSSSRAPIPNDDEFETETEAKSSEDEIGDDSGSSSHGGAGDDALGPSSRKWTKTDSHA